MPCNQTLTVADLIEHAGGSLRVALTCGVAEVSVQRWARENYIPNRSHFEPLRSLARMPKEEFYDSIVLAQKV